MTASARDLRLTSRYADQALVTEELAAGARVILRGSSIQEAADVARAAVDELPGWVVVWVDLDRCGSRRHLDQAVRNGVIEALTDQSGAANKAPSAFGKDALDVMVELRRRAPEILEDIHDEPESSILGPALEALRDMGSSQPTLLCVDAAELLVEPSRFEGEVGWVVRAVTQFLPGLNVLLTGGAGAHALDADTKAAFYGWGTTISLDALTPGDLAGEIRERLRDLGLGDEVGPITELAAGSATAASQVSAAMTGTASALTAFQDQLTLFADHFRFMARAAAGQHRVALEVCQAIARGDPPYAVPGARHPSAPQRAIERLRRIGLIEPIRRGRWRLTDPLFAAWLRRPSFETSASRRRS